MEREHWQKVDRLLQSALEVDESQRAAFIEHACAGDETLQREVGSLLAQLRGTGFLETPAVALVAQTLEEAGAPRIPPAVGRYRVKRLLGEGGMGAVYEAEQDQPRRTVALKVIRPGFTTAETLRRFQHESEALGRLQHAGIAQIFEASTADAGSGPQPYFAMELIRGRSLQEHAKLLSTRERLTLMAKICDAVEHAHQRGVIHRDLKPGNILVDETGQPKVLDFGVARVTGSDVQLTRQTDAGQLVGTLAYMSPEQVFGEPGDLDTRSDVYALGVILYELLAGKLPYEVLRKPLPEAMQTVREQEPAHLSSIGRSFRGDIETIVAKALEKDKARRYGSAAELAADIRRYLADEPIAARPASASYQLQKFARRHKAQVAGTAAVFVVLAAGIVVSTWEAVRARQAETVAVQQRDRAAAAERLATAQRDRAIAADARAQQGRSAALAEKERADAEAATAQAVNDFLRNDLLAQAGPSNQSSPRTKPDPDLKVRTALDRAAARIAGKFDRQPEVEAAIRDTIGQAYYDLGLAGEARNQFERALELERIALGSANQRTLRIMDHLAPVLEPAESEATYRDALRIQRAVLGSEHPDTLASMQGLGDAYLQQGKYAQAEALHRQTFEIRRRTLGANHPDTLKSMQMLAIAYAHQGKSALAEKFFAQAMEIRRRVLGPEHPDTLRSMQNLAVVYGQEGKYAQAEPLFNQILEFNRRVWGPEHPATMITMNNVGNNYFWEGKYAQAEALFGQALDIVGRVSSPESNDAQLFTTNLAGAYSAHGKYQEAEALVNRVLEVQRRMNRTEHPYTLECLSNAAFLYQREGKYNLAEAYAANALTGRRHVLGTQHPDTIRSVVDLALAYQSQDKFAESEPLAREAVDYYRKERPDDWQRFRAESLLGASFAGQKKYPEAEPLLLRGYRGMAAHRDRIPAPDWYHCDRAREWLIQLYQAWGKPDEAAKWKQNRGTPY